MELTFIIILNIFFEFNIFLRLYPQYKFQNFRITKYLAMCCVVSVQSIRNTDTSKLSSKLNKVEESYDFISILNMYYKLRHDKFISDSLLEQDSWKSWDRCNSFWTCKFVALIFFADKYCERCFFVWSKQSLTSRHH